MDTTINPYDTKELEVKQIRDLTNPDYKCDWEQCKQRGIREYVVGAPDYSGDVFILCENHDDIENAVELYKEYSRIREE